MPKDSDGVEITDEMRKASQQALIDMDTRDNPRARELEAKRNAVLKKNAPPEPAKPNPTSQEPDMLHNKIPISNELAASLTKPRPPANEDAILREWHAAGLEPQRLTNGQLMSLHLWRTLQEAQQKPTQTSSR